MSSGLGRPHPALLELAAGRQVPTVTDPARLVVSAIEHRMVGLLTQAISRGEVAVPDPWHRDLVRLHLAQRAEHRRLWGAIRHCQDRLAEVGVEPAFIKGVVSELRWYDGEGERPCADIDLLLGPDDVRRIADVVAALDPAYPWLAQVRQLVEAGHLQSVVLEVGGIDADIHVDALKLGPPSRAARELWDRCASLIESHPPVRVLDPSTALVVFLVHLNKDRFAYLREYVDVLRILALSDIDWAWVAEFARAEGIEVAVYASLHAVHEDLGLRANGLPPVPGGWRSLAWRALWGPQTRLLGHEGKLTSTRRWFWMAFLARRPIWPSIRWWVRHLFPPPAVVEMNLPDATGPYLWRLFRGRRQLARARRRLTEDLADHTPTAAG